MTLLQRLLSRSVRPPRLSIELVPQSQWGANLSQALAGERWDQLRRSTYKAAGHRCQVCGGKGAKWPVEAHEEWEYSDSTGVQRLVALVALCPSCHEVKHIGRANRVGRGDAALRHLIRVNNWSQDRALEYIAGAFAAWEQRSVRTWRLDLSLLAQYGVQPPSEAELAASAGAAQAAYGVPLPAEHGAQAEEELVDAVWNTTHPLPPNVRVLTEEDIDVLLGDDRCDEEVLAIRLDEGLLEDADEEVQKLLWEVVLGPGGYEPHRQPEREEFSTRLRKRGYEGVAERPL